MRINLYCAGGGKYHRQERRHSEAISGRGKKDNICILRTTILGQLLTFVVILCWHQHRRAVQRSTSATAAARRGLWRWLTIFINFISTQLFYHWQFLINYVSTQPFYFVYVMICQVTGNTESIFKAFTLICNKFEEVSFLQPNTISSLYSPTIFATFFSRVFLWSGWLRFNLYQRWWVNLN